MNNDDNFDLTIRMGSVEEVLSANNNLAKLLKEEGLNFDNTTLWLILDVFLETTITEEIIEREYVHRYDVNKLFKKAVNLGFLSPEHAEELWTLKKP